MKNLILPSICIFALSTSAGYAGPGASRLASPEMLNLSKSFVSRTYSGGFRMSKKLYPQMQKRSFSTKLRTEGYKPKEEAVIPQRHTVPWPKKVEYLDDTYEVFRTPSGFKEKLEESVKRAHTEQSFPEKMEKKK